MPEDENTESVMNRTPLIGLARGSLLKFGEPIRQAWSQHLSRSWQMWGVPKSMADGYARMVTFSQ